MTDGHADSEALDGDQSIEGLRLMAAVEHRLGLAPELRSPKIGRFSVLERLGEGGMGVVYAVYDADLDRRVALKLIRGGHLPQLRARLQREAQALAKLSHPNVVPVFEVGEHEGEAFLAMEFVRGQTLRQWVDGSDRDAAEIVDKYVQAGRGLAAAHGAGLVHRDFKPDNAIVGDGGRVRVLDFGLAHAGGDDVDATTRSDSDGPSNESAGHGAFDIPLTVTGSMVGTPYYMAPEQLASEATDHRSDQFSFCVSLWEALCGQRPFVGETLDELRDAVQRGIARTPEQSAKLPTRLRPVLERGLRVEREERWPSMESLLAALGEDPTRARPKRWLVLAGLGFGAGGIGLALAFATDQQEPCTQASEQLAGVWDAATRDRVEAAVSGTGLPYAAEAWTRTAAALDAHAEAWTQMHTEACLATAVRVEQSSDVLDLRMACLHRAKVEMGAIVRVFEDADADVLARAHELVDGLADLRGCADIEALQSGLEPPREQDADMVDAIRADLADSRAARIAGRHEEAQRTLEAAKGRLAELRYDPVRLEVGLVEGSVLNALGRYDAAEQAYRGALELATRRVDSESMRDAAIELLSIVGSRQRREEEALHAYRMLAEHLSQGDSLAEARFATSYGFVLASQWKYAEAEAQMRRSLDLRVQTLGPDHPAVAHAHGAIAAMLQYQGRLEDAKVEERRSLTLLERALGPEHPRVAASRISLGTILRVQGKLDEAESEYRRALAIQQPALGPSHPSVGDSHTGLAIVLDQKGDLEGAEAEFRLALQIAEEALGHEHPDVAAASDNLALVLSNQRKYAAAEVVNRRALEIWEKVLGPQHPDVAFCRSNLGLVLGKQGRHDEEVAEHRGALAIFEAKLGPEHPDVAMSRNHLAVALLKLGQNEEALALAELAWQRRQRDDIPAFDQAETAQVLAHALWAIDTDAASRDRVRALAKRALPAYEQAGDRHTKTIRWLRQRLADPT